jgi:hypothetical protein
MSEPLRLARDNKRRANRSDVGNDPGAEPRQCDDILGAQQVCSCYTVEVRAIGRQARASKDPKAKARWNAVRRQGGQPLKDVVVVYRSQSVVFGSVYVKRPPFDELIYGLITFATTQATVGSDKGWCTKMIYFAAVRRRHDISDEDLTATWLQ